MPRGTMREGELVRTGNYTEVENGKVFSSKTTSLEINILS